MLAPSSPLSLIRIEHGQARLEYRGHILVIGSGEFGTDHVPQATSEIVRAANAHDALVARVAELEKAAQEALLFLDLADARLNNGERIMRERVRAALRAANPDTVTRNPHYHDIPA